MTQLRTMPGSARCKVDCKVVAGVQQTWMLIVPATTAKASVAYKIHTPIANAAVMSPQAKLKAASPTATVPWMMVKNASRCCYCYACLIVCCANMHFPTYQHSKPCAWLFVLEHSLHLLSGSADCALYMQQQLLCRLHHSQRKVWNESVFFTPTETQCCFKAFQPSRFVRPSTLHPTPLPLPRCASHGHSRMAIPLQARVDSMQKNISPASLQTGDLLTPALLQDLFPTQNLIHRCGKIFAHNLFTAQQKHAFRTHNCYCKVSTWQHTSGSSWQRPCILHLACAVSALRLVQCAHPCTHLACSQRLQYRVHSP